MGGAQPLWAPLGELLVERGLLSERQLELALQEHNRTGRPLGEVLVGFGFVSEDALADTLLEQVGLSTREPEPTQQELTIVTTQAAQPLILRVDVDEPRTPGASVRGRTAELEATVLDFERRTAEIQHAIGEMRALVAQLTA